MMVMLFLGRGDDGRGGGGNFFLEIIQFFGGKD